MVTSWGQGPPTRPLRPIMSAGASARGVWLHRLTVLPDNPPLSPHSAWTSTLIKSYTPDPGKCRPGYPLGHIAPLIYALLVCIDRE